MLILSRRASLHRSLGGASPNLAVKHPRHALARESCPRDEDTSPNLWQGRCHWWDGVTCLKGRRRRQSGLHSIRQQRHSAPKDHTEIVKACLRIPFLNTAEGRLHKKALLVDHIY